MTTMDKHDDYVARLRRAIVQAICEASVPEPDPATGDRGDTLYIGSADVCEALTILLAEFLEGVPGIDTPRDIRAISETVAKKIRRGIAEIRAQRAITGAAPPRSIIIRSN
jgi:hypothetical protein